MTNTTEAHSRRTDPSTSKAAAAACEASAEAIEMVTTALRLIGPATDEAIAAWLRMRYPDKKLKDQSVRRIRLGLERIGVVRQARQDDAPAYGETEAGNKSRLWELTEERPKRRSVIGADYTYVEAEAEAKAEPKQSAGSRQRDLFGDADGN